MSPGVSGDRAQHQPSALHSSVRPLPTSHEPSPLSSPLRGESSPLSSPLGRNLLERSVTPRVRILGVLQIVGWVGTPRNAGYRPCQGAYVKGSTRSPQSLALHTHARRAIIVVDAPQHRVAPARLIRVRVPL